MTIELIGMTWIDYEINHSMKYHQGYGRTTLGPKACESKKR